MEKSVLHPTTENTQLGCTGASCPKLGCDKHYTSSQKCPSERTGIIKDTKSNNQKKQYQCGMCSKSFAQSISLKRHVRTHTGEKPFACKDCGRRFTNSSHLTTHMRTHTGERPFQCDMCGKKFSQHSGLHVHIRTHTGDKPYKCDICRKGFLDRSALKRHSSTHLNDRNKTRKAASQPRKYRKIEVVEVDPELDNIAALICVKTLQEYLSTLGITLLLHQQTLSSLALYYVLLHTLTSAMTYIKPEPEDTPAPTPSSSPPETNNPQPARMPFICTVTTVSTLPDFDQGEMDPVKSHIN